MSNASLQMATLEEAILTASNFEDADLTLANFTGADLKGSIILTANTKWADFSKTDFDEHFS